MTDILHLLFFSVPQRLSLWLGSFRKFVEGLVVAGIMALKGTVGPCPLSPSHKANYFAHYVPSCEAVPQHKHKNYGTNQPWMESFRTMSRNNLLPFIICLSWDVFCFYFAYRNRELTHPVWRCRDMHRIQCGGRGGNWNNRSAGYRTPEIASLPQHQERAGNRVPPHTHTEPYKWTDLPTCLFSTSRLQNCELGSFCCFKPPSLWCFITTAVGN